jgi:hypothetical protein
MAGDERRGSEVKKVVSGRRPSISMLRASDKRGVIVSVWVGVRVERAPWCPGREVGDVATSAEVAQYDLFFFFFCL